MPLGSPPWLAVHPFSSQRIIPEASGIGIPAVCQPGGTGLVKCWQCPFVFFLPPAGLPSLFSPVSSLTYRPALEVVTLTRTPAEGC